MVEKKLQDYFRTIPIGGHVIPPAVGRLLWRPGRPPCPTSSRQARRRRRHPDGPELPRDPSTVFLAVHADNLGSGAETKVPSAMWRYGISGTMPPALLTGRWTAQAAGTTRFRLLGRTVAQRRRSYDSQAA